MITAKFVGHAERFSLLVVLWRPSSHRTVILLDTTSAVLEGLAPSRCSNRGWVNVGDRCRCADGVYHRRRVLRRLKGVRRLLAAPVPPLLTIVSNDGLWKVPQAELSQALGHRLAPLLVAELVAASGVAQLVLTDHHGTSLIAVVDVCAVLSRAVNLDNSDPAIDRWLGRWSTGRETKAEPGVSTDDSCIVTGSSAMVAEKRKSWGSEISRCCSRQVARYREVNTEYRTVSVLKQSEIPAQSSTDFSNSEVRSVKLENSPSPQVDNRSAVVMRWAVVGEEKKTEEEG